MPKTRKNSMLYPPLPFLSMFTWRCASIGQIQVCLTDENILSQLIGKDKGAGIPAFLSQAVAIIGMIRYNIDRLL
jgi:hypothetical protein